MEAEQFKALPDEQQEGIRRVYHTWNAGVPRWEGWDAFLETVQAPGGIMDWAGVEIPDGKGGVLIYLGVERDGYTHS